MALNLYRLNAPESEIFVQGQMKSIGEKGETTFNATHIRKDGTLFPMEVFAKKVVWDNEQAILSIATDITDRVRSEKVLKEFQSNLTALIDHSEDAITLRDAEGKMITCSKVYEKNLKSILGIDAKPGIRTLDYLPEEVRDENEKIIAKVLAGEKHRRESHWEAEGKEYYFESSLNPVKVDNQIIGTVEISRDITDRVIYEKRIREMAERMDLATRAAHIGIWDWDLQKNEVIWNEEMYTLYGIDRDSISNIYDAWINSLYPDDRPAHDKLVSQVIRGEIEYDTEFRVVLPDGAIRHIKAFGQVLWDADGKALRMTGINSDITERKKMEARIQQSQKLEAIGNLAGGIAHDFNNILFPIVGMAELLMDDKATPASFDLVVSDMAMPNMTGDQFAGELISIRSDIPIIICTGFSERINKEKAAGYGVKGFLLKPIVKSEMAFMVRSVLDGVKVES